MAHFTPITQSEMESLLAPWGFALIEVPGTVELVWAKVRRDEGQPIIQLRIYSGINPTGESRGVGEDAIRVEAFWITPAGNLYRIGGSKRVHRVAGWRNNLTARVRAWRELLGPECPQCGAPMVLRTVKKPGPNKGKEFYSCASWRDTGCNGFQWAVQQDLRPAA